MSARAKIENLTHTWYGFAVFSAVAGLLMEGISVWNLVTGGIGLFFTLLFMFFLSRRLINKGRITRLLLIAVSGISTVFGAWGAAKAGWMFVHAWELQLVIAAASSAISAWMMAKSFRVLTDASVKAYFA